jgi:hypothetical protein
MKFSSIEKGLSAKAFKLIPPITSCGKIFLQIAPQRGETTNKNAALSIIIIAILAFPILAGLFANSLRPVISDPMIPVPGLSPSAAVSGITSTSSYNWAGYAVVTKAAKPVTDVKGSWIVPSYTGAACNANQEWDSVFFVGIDGFSSKTVEQIGTEIFCFEGTVSYDAWYEFYPANSLLIAHAIFPGDAMSAEVKWVTGTTFTLSIQDTTSGHVWSFSITGSVNGAKRTSAEWIAESPFDILGELPLAPFGTVSFTGGTAVTTVHTGTIGSFTTGVYMINGVCFPSGAPIKLQPSALDFATGANFNVGYLLPGPEG